MNPWIKLTFLPFIFLNLTTSPQALEPASASQDPHLYGPVSLHIESVIKIKFDPDEQAPSEFFVSETVNGMTYSGLIQTLDVNFYNTGARDVTYYGMIALN